MLKVIFPNLPPAAAEFVAERFFDSKSSPELVEKLLTNKISSEDFLILLKRFCEAEFDSWADMERELQSDYSDADEHESAFIA